MKTKIDEVYKELKSRLKYNLKFTDNALENIEILNKAVEMTHISKSGLKELEQEYPGGTSYLMYLLQSNNDVNLGLCPDFKIWYSSAGVQTRCKHNKGTVQVHCQRLLKLCSRKNKDKK